MSLIDDLAEADRSLTSFFSFSSGAYASVSTNSPEATNGEPCVEEGSREHHRPDYNNECRAVLGLLLGQVAKLVRPRVDVSCKTSQTLTYLRSSSFLEPQVSATPREDAGPGK